MDGDDVRAAGRAMTGVLFPETGRDWDVPAGTLSWSCRQTLVHVAHDLLAYAGQLVAQPADRYLPSEFACPDDAEPATVLTIAGAAASLLSGTLDEADPDSRAWHFGPTDPTGFAAMGVGEILLHTYDITAGLGLGWRPSPALCEGALHRLFPAATEGEPVAELLWSTGRADLPGRPHQTDWVWRSAR